MNTVVVITLHVKGDFSVDSGKRLATIVEANARNMTRADVSASVTGRQVDGGEVMRGGKTVSRQPKF